MTPYIVLAALIVGGIGAYTAQEWRYGEKLATIKAEQATALSKAYAKTQALQDKINTTDQLAVEALDDLQKQNDILRAKYSAAGKRLRIKATCVPADTSTTTVDNAGTAELSAEAGRTVFDLRSGVIELESRLSALQSYVRLVIALNADEAGN